MEKKENSRIWASIGDHTYGTVLARTVLSCQKCAKTTKGKIRFDGEDKITVCIIYEK